MSLLALQMACISDWMPDDFDVQQGPVAGLPIACIGTFQFENIFDKEFIC